MPSLTVYATLPAKKTLEPGFCISEDFSLPGWLLTNTITHPQGYLIPLPKEVQGTSYGTLPWTSPPSNLFDIIAIRSDTDKWLSSNDIVQFEHITLPSDIAQVNQGFYFSAWFYEEPNAKHQWYLSMEFSYPGFGGTDKGQAFRLSLTNQGRLLVERWDGSNWIPKKIITLRDAQEPIQGWFDFWCYPINLDDRLILLFYGQNASYAIIQKENLTISNPQIVFWAPVRYLFKISPLSFPTDPIPCALSPVFSAPYTPTIAPQLSIVGKGANISLVGPDGQTSWSPSTHGGDMRVKVTLSGLSWARRFIVKFPSSTGDAPATPTDISSKTLYLEITRSLQIPDENARIRLKDPTAEITPTRNLPFGVKWDNTAIFLGYLREPRAKEILQGREWELTAEGLAFRLRNTFLQTGDAYDGAVHTDVVQEICALAGIPVQVQGTSTLQLPKGTPEQGFLWQVDKGTSCLDMLQRIVEYTGWELISAFSVDANGYPTGSLIYRPPQDPLTTSIKAKFWKTTAGASQTPPAGVFYSPLIEFREETTPPEANEIWVCGMDYYGYPIIQYWLNTASLTDPTNEDYLGFRKAFVEVNASLNTVEAVQQRLEVLKSQKGHTKRRYEWVGKWQPTLQPGDFVEIEGVDGKIKVLSITLTVSSHETTATAKYEGVKV